MPRHSIRQVNERVNEKYQHVLGFGPIHVDVKMIHFDVKMDRASAKSIVGSSDFGNVVLAIMGSCVVCWYAPGALVLVLSPCECVLDNGQTSMSTLGFPTMSGVWMIKVNQTDVNSGNQSGSIRVATCLVISLVRHVDEPTGSITMECLWL